MKEIYCQFLRLISLWVAVSAVAGMFLVSCQGQQTAKKKTQGHNDKLAGTWVLNAKIADGQQVPITERMMRLTLNPAGTFQADYRGNETQKWIVAGRGGFAYAPPILTLHWESGAASNLLVTEPEPDKLLVHHGRNLVPLKDQEPDEIFQRQKSEKGPTRTPS